MKRPSLPVPTPPPFPLPFLPRLRAGTSPAPPARGVVMATVMAMAITVVLAFPLTAAAGPPVPEEETKPISISIPAPTPTPTPTPAPEPGEPFAVEARAAGGGDGGDGPVLPLIIQPAARQAYLRASNPGVADQFAFSVAISRDTAVVGAIAEASMGKGVNGDQTDSGIRAGAAYVFVRKNGVWTQEAYLKAPRPWPNDNFGCSVAVSGDTILVGAMGERGTKGGVNPNDQVWQTPGYDLGHGAAFVFVRRDGVWTRQAYLKSRIPRAGDQFGHAVALDGDTAVVGALSESNGSLVSTGGGQLRARDAGAVYVFVRQGSEWGQQAYLKPSNNRAGNFFGCSVAIHGNTLAAGATGDSSNGGINAPPGNGNGQQGNTGAPYTGAVHVFLRRNGVWTPQAYLKASNHAAGHAFGWSVAVHHDTIIASAHGEMGASSGVNGVQTAQTLRAAGVAYVFRRRSMEWRQEAYLKAGQPGAGQRFGKSVALDGNLAVVGAGLNYQSSKPEEEAESAAVFVRREDEDGGAVWTQEHTLTAALRVPGEGFGTAVAVSGDTVLAGAAREAGASSGVNGDPLQRGMVNSGAAWLFTGFAAPPLPVPTLSLSLQQAPENGNGNSASPRRLLEWTNACGWYLQTSDDMTHWTILEDIPANNPVSQVEDTPAERQFFRLSR